MKTAPLISSSRVLVGLAVAGAALLSASSASAQTTALPYYSFTVNNFTNSFGPVYSVADSVTFQNVQVNETFMDANGAVFTQSIGLPNVENQDKKASSAQVFSFGSGVFTDPIHGTLTSAVLTGSLIFPGFVPTDTLMLTIQPTSDMNNTYQQSVFTPFSASLFGAAPTGIAVGTFSLNDLSGNPVGGPVTIDAAPVPAAVPEASTTLSLGLLLALGALAVTRRRAARAN